MSKLSEILGAVLTPINTVLAITVYLSLYYFKQRFFGPLRHLPGPWWSNYTQLPDHFHLFFVGDRSLYVHSLHEKYGDTLRLGPNTVGVTGQEAVKTIFGGGSKRPFHKEPVLATILNFRRIPDETMAGITDPKSSAKRRMMYGSVYSRGNILNMQDIYQKCFMTFITKLEEARMNSQDGIIGVTWYFRVLAFDVLTEAAFGGFWKGTGYGTDIVDILDNVMGANLFQFYFGTPIYNLMMKIPWKKLDWLRAKEEYCEMTLKVVSVYQSKVKAHPDRVRKDLLGNLISNNLDPKRLYAEAYGNIFAGTDTTTSALGLLALAIIRHPRVYKILVAELDRAFPPGEYVPFASMELQKLETECPYLTCCIKESLRWDPLVPGPNLRVVPKEGTNINGWFVPGDTLIFAQTRSTNYDAKVFPDPKIFIPERWQAGKETAEMGAMMTSFGSGPRVCAGENLAVMELHCVTALLFRNYTLSIPDGYDNDYLEFWLRRPKGGNVFLRIEPREV